MSDLHKNLIDGAWVDGDAAPNVNPSDVSDIVGHYARASADQTRTAIGAARAAFADWSRSSPLVRHGILRRASDEILARKDELGRLLSREEGKTLAEGVGEVTRAAQIFDFFAGEALRLAGEILPSVRPGVGVEITREAVGVVGIITPWNFPIAIPAWKLAPALCYGNTVVFKPADLVPGSAWALVDILNRAGLQKGVLNLVMGRGSVVGQTMADSPDIDALTFTGSQGTGAALALASARHMRKSQMEMGGKNPFVVLADADLSIAADCVVNGAFFSTGQRCTASSRIIVDKAVYSGFVDLLAERIQGLRIGHALRDDTQIGPVVDESQLSQNESYIAKGKAEGARLVTGGDRLNRDTEGFFQSPALFADCTNDMVIAREEIFGPVAAVIPVDGYDEALAVANDTPFGLSAGIATTSLKHATDFRRNAEAGMVMINLPTAGVDFHVPFGGRKASSFGPANRDAMPPNFSPRSRPLTRSPNAGQCKGPTP